jgi:hypothetical protein
MKEGLTEIVAILDKSGSMEEMTRDTIGGYNHFKAAAFLSKSFILKCNLYQVRVD